MIHYSSTFFVSKENPLVPTFHSMSTPCLTIKASSFKEQSSISIHFETFEEIKKFSDDLKSLLSLQNEKFSTVEEFIKETK
jgi:hypothetical protein